MNKLLFILFILIGIRSFGQSNTIDPAYKKMLGSYYKKEVPIILPQDLQKKLEKEKIILLDVREYEEYQVSHLKDAIFVGSSKISWDKINELNKNQAIVVYCSIGARSQDLAIKLKEKGYTNVSNLYGGLFLWNNQARAIYKKEKITKDIHGYNKDWSKWIKTGKVVY